MSFEMTFEGAKGVRFEGSHGDSHEYGYGVDMGTVMNPRGSERDFE